MQYGHVNRPAVVHPDNISLPRKSMMVHINAILNWKICFVEMPYAKIPTSHNSFNLAISDCKKKNIYSSYLAIY